MNTLLNKCVVKNIVKDVIFYNIFIPYKIKEFAHNILFNKNMYYRKWIRRFGLKVLYNILI